MSEAALKPIFTQAEIEEFGELLDIARFLLERATAGEVSQPVWDADYFQFVQRRKAFIELVYGRLNPTGKTEDKR